MSATIINFVAILFYFITWLLIIKHVRAQIQAGGAKQKGKPLYLVLWVLGLVVHLLGLHYPLFENKPLTLSFFSLASYVMWFISFILFITTIKRRLESLAIFIIPSAILSIVLAMYLGMSSGVSINVKSGLGAHIFTSLLAYSLLMLASFQALLLAFQNNKLRSLQVSGFSSSLPSLEDMEHLLFRFINIGVLFLSIALVTGFYFLDNLFGSQVAHKTILSLISWVVFSALIFGRWKYGWRGKKAINWTLAGFAILMLAFFGTKFVQEFLL